ncbi:MAG: putative lipid II flippase FtsW [Pseudomonadota bacterium]|nr:putative lipid II flippase FtsW [Pseudomonadota bacterium]
MTRRKPEGPLDQILLLLFLTLTGIGLVQVFSTSFIFATESHGDGMFFLKKQLMFTVLAFIALFVCAYFPWKWFERLAPLLWIVCALLLLATFVPGVGVKAGGASRWIGLPFGFRLQPSELMKVALPFYFSYLLVHPMEWLGKHRWTFRILSLFLPLGILLFQPDFGSFAVMLMVLILLLVAFGLRWSYIITATISTSLLFFILIMESPYRRARLFSYLDPWSERNQSGFQLIQSLLSFRSGGLAGVGLGQGQGKLFFLPEAHTDFTLAVLGEELGFCGVFIVLSLFGFLIYRGFQIALRASSEFERSVALGLIMIFSLSVFVNVGVALGILPTKGLALPFLSYGGSSLITLGIIFGLLLNIRRRINHWAKR